MNTARLCLVYVAFVATNSGSCSAQVILYGCTATLTATPQTSKLVDIDPATGLSSNPRDIGIGFIAGIAVQPSTGNLFGLTSFASTPANSLVSIDPMTGIPTLIGATGLPTIVEGDLAFNPVDGQLYGLYDGINPNDRTLFQIDPLTGTAITIGNIAPMGDFSALAFSPAGNLYAINSSGSSPSLLVAIDVNTAAINNSINLNFNLGATVGMAFDPTTGLAWVGDGGENATNSLYTLNIGNGMLDLVGTIGFPSGIAGLTFVTVPEPSSIVLLVIPAIIYMIARRSLTAAFVRGFILPTWRPSCTE